VRDAPLQWVRRELLRQASGQGPPAQAECFPPAETRDQQHPVQRVQRILDDRGQERCRIAAIPSRSPGSLHSRELDGCRWVAADQPALDRGVQRGLAGGVDPAQRFRPDGTLPLVVTAGDGYVHRLEMVGSYRGQPVVSSMVMYSWK